MVTCPFTVIIRLVKADESSDLPDLGPDPLYLLGKCEESLQLHFCIFKEWWLLMSNLKLSLPSQNDLRQNVMIVV